MRFLAPSILGLVSLASTAAVPVTTTNTTSTGAEAVETAVETASPEINVDASEVPTKFADVREKIVKEYKNVEEIPTAKYFSRCP
ncbi:hypothetical protein VI817_010317 [Penicillium citrinum]|nr:hypothetical protein VI817_010317 [Penicillium citrinum]